MPHAFSFPAALIDWTHEWNHFVFTHPKSAASDNRFHRSLLDLEQEVGEDILTGKMSELQF